MTNRFLFSAALYLACVVVHAAPSVSGNTISWPDDGWYQVQNTSDYTTVCNGGTSCVVEPGIYKVINHTIGEKYRGIEVAGSSTGGSDTGGSPSGVSVNGNVISWPDDGWYQVQNIITYMTVCSGGTSCEVEPGTYKVINHSTGEKFRGIEVSGSNTSGSGTGGSPTGVSVSVSGNVISWPDDGWYQVQNSSDFSTVCSGGTSCVVEPGTYKVINHTTGEKFRGIEVSESAGQGRTRVTFDINVPTYVSNELQVQLEWGEIDINASWLVDEFWSASVDLPSNTSNLLVVTFADRNGRIELGTYEQQLSIGSNASEPYLIQADQFDTARWDADGDGNSNLNELLAGDDPLVDESLSLEIRDSLSELDARIVVNSIKNYSSYYETSIPNERPYFEDEQVVTPHYEYLESWGTLYDRKTVTIDIDSFGNGTFSDVDRVEHDPSDHTTIGQKGTRTNTGSSIHWDASYYRWNRGAACYTDNDEFTTETSRLSEDRIKQEGVHKRTGRCSNSNSNFDTTYTLTGIEEDDSPYCKALSGTITAGSGWTINGEIIISKNASDLYWKLSRYNQEGQQLEEYLADIELSFYCDFSEM